MRDCEIEKEELGSLILTFSPHTPSHLPSPSYSSLTPTPHTHFTKMLFTVAALLAPLAAVAVAQDAAPLTTADTTPAVYTPDPAWPSCPLPVKRDDAEPIQGQVWAPDLTGNMVSDDVSDS